MVAAVSLSLNAHPRLDHLALHTQHPANLGIVSLSLHVFILFVSLPRLLVSSPFLPVVILLASILVLFLSHLYCLGEGACFVTTTHLILFPLFTRFNVYTYFISCCSVIFILLRVGPQKHLIVIITPNAQIRDRGNAARHIQKNAYTGEGTIGCFIDWDGA
jgi:hypothetical protein